MQLNVNCVYLGDEFICVSSHDIQAIYPGNKTDEILLKIGTTWQLIFKVIKSNNYVVGFFSNGTLSIEHVQIRIFVWIFNCDSQSNSYIVVHHIFKHHIASIIWGPFHIHGLTWISVWISIYIPYKVCDEITYPFPNLNGNFITDFTGHVIIYPCWD